MAGNIAEWAQDWFGNDYYTIMPERNPQGPATGRYKSVRGGSWKSNPNLLRAATRNGAVPDQRAPTIGIRCAQPVPFSFRGGYWTPSSKADLFTSRGLIQKRAPYWPVPAQTASMAGTFFSPGTPLPLTVNAQNLEFGPPTGTKKKKRRAKTYQTGTF